MPVDRRDLDREQPVVDLQVGRGGHGERDLVDRRLADGQVGVGAVAERQLAGADVGRLDCHGQAVLADPMGDHGLERAGPAGLRIDPHPVGHRVRLLVDQHPGHVAGQPMAGVVPGRLAQRELLGDSRRRCSGRRGSGSARGSGSDPGQPLIISSTANPRTTSRPSTA